MENMQANVWSWDWPGEVPGCSIRAMRSINLKVDLGKSPGSLRAPFPDISLFPGSAEGWFEERKTLPDFEAQQPSGSEGDR